MESCGEECGCVSRRFYTNKEKLECLKDYKENLELETKAVAEKIKGLEKTK